MTEPTRGPLAIRPTDGASGTNASTSPAALVVELSHWELDALVPRHNRQIRDHVTALDNVAQPTRSRMGISSGFGFIAGTVPEPPARPEEPGTDASRSDHP